MNDENIHCRRPLDIEIFQICTSVITSPIRDPVGLIASMFRFHSDSTRHQRESTSRTKTVFSLSLQTCDQSTAELQCDGPSPNRCHDSGKRSTTVSSAECIVARPMYRWRLALRLRSAAASYSFSNEKRRRKSW